MEPRLGHDFSAVRVHSDPAAAASAQALGAAAYSVGWHIMFGAGRYRPETPPGARLLAHELAHVLQGATADTKNLPLLSDPADPAERQAEAVAHSIQGGQPTRPVRGGPAALIQRTPETWFRGEALGVAPSRAGGALHDFGDGFYLTDSPEVAGRYAMTRAGDKPLTARAFSVTVDSQRLGRVLDLTQDVRWQAFLKSRLSPQLPTNETLIRQANENYSRLFKQFVEINKIPLEQFDAIKGPEFVRGGTQLCIRNPQIQAELRAAFVDLPISPSMASSTEAAGASVAGRSTGTVAAETATAVEASAARATTAAEATAAATRAESTAATAAVAGRGVRVMAIGRAIAIGLLETAVLAIVTLGLDYLKRKAEQEHLRRDLEAAQPKIASSIAVLMPQARLLQAQPMRRTVWATISIKLHSWVTEMFSDYGFAHMVEMFQGASFLEPATLSLQYRRDRRTEHGERMRSIFQGGSSTSYDAWDIVTFSIPIPYDAESLDPAGRRARIAQIEADAAIADLPVPVHLALFQERELLLRPPPTLPQIISLP